MKKVVPNLICFCFFGSGVLAAMIPARSRNSRDVWEVCSTVDTKMNSVCYGMSLLQDLNRSLLNCGRIEKLASKFKGTLSLDLF